MELRAELSLYPLAGDVDSSVLAFIEDLISTNSVSVITNAMSTQIRGDSQAVFSAVQTALEASYARCGRQVLVAKFLPGTAPQVNPDGS